MNESHLESINEKQIGKSYKINQEGRDKYNEMGSSKLVTLKRGRAWVCLLRRVLSKSFGSLHQGVGSITTECLVAQLAARARHVPLATYMAR